MMPEYDHIWFWRSNELRRIDRKGHRCRVLVRGFALAMTRLANAPLGLRSFLLCLRPF